jgi:hypothetical protein
MQPSTQPSTQPSQAPSTDTTTPAPSPSTAPSQAPTGQPGTQQTPAPAQAPIQPAQPSQPTPAPSPITQDTQTPAPTDVSVPSTQIQTAPSKELIEQQCYQGYGSPTGTSAGVPKIRPGVSAQSGGTPVVQVDVTRPAKAADVPSSLCAGWVGAPSARFPNADKTPEFPIMSSGGGIEMLPILYAEQRWSNYGH